MGFGSPPNTALSDRTLASPGCPAVPEGAATAGRAGATGAAPAGALPGGIVSTCAATGPTDRASAAAKSSGFLNKTVSLASRSLHGGLGRLPLVDESCRRGDEVLDRQRAEAELDPVAPGTDLDASEQQVCAQNGARLPVHGRFPPGIEDVVQDHHAGMVGVDVHGHGIALVPRHADRAMRRLRGERLGAAVL